MPIRPIRRAGQSPSDIGVLSSASPSPRVRERPILVPEAHDDTPSHEPSYKVGKNRPPLHSRWKKGQSGNPKGRPKGSHNYDSIALDFYAEKVMIGTATGARAMDLIELALNKRRELVGKGNVNAIAQTLDEARRLMPAPVASGDAPPAGEDLTAGERALLAMLLKDQMIEPMVMGRPVGGHPDIIGASSALAVHDVDPLGTEDLDDEDDIDRIDEQEGRA